MGVVDGHIAVLVNRIGHRGHRIVGSELIAIFTQGVGTPSGNYTESIIIKYVLPQWHGDFVVIDSTHYP